MIQTTRCKLLFCISILVYIVITSGCTSTSSNSSSSDMPPISNSIESHSDIVLPTDLKWESSKSMSIKTDSFTGGIFHYSGKIDVNSLKEYIITSMSSNKWKLVGEASYKDIMLAFIKPNKTCMITLSEGFGGALGKTHVKLYVTVDLAAAKGLNPFGEPIN